MKSAATAIGAGFEMTDGEKAHINRAIAISEMADMIDKDYVVTVNSSTMTMEFTAPYSPIIPTCIVTGRDVCGTRVLTAVAGPGRSADEITLAAYREVVQRRISRARIATMTEAN